MRRPTLLLLAAFAASALGATGTQSGFPTKGMLDPNAPIQVTADNFLADANAKTGVYSGNVIIHQGQVQMHADAVRVHVVDNKPDKIYAKGHVVVAAPSGIATGDSGVYDVNPRVITLHGNVVLTKNNDVMRGQVLTVNLLSGEATLNGGQGQGGRVQGLFTQTRKSANGEPAQTQNP